MAGCQELAREVGMLVELDADKIGHHGQTDVRPADLAAGLRAKLGRFGSSRGEAVMLTDRERRPPAGYRQPR